MQRNKLLISLLIGVTFFFYGCYKEELVTLQDWTTESHSGDATPDYSIVFDDSKVNRIDIVIDEKDWEDMQDDLSDIVGSSVGGPQGNFSEETPIYVECEFYFNDIQWYHVGIRYKGNSSLNAYNSGIKKLPFRLEFDKFEDKYPEIKNQKFYGFEELSLSSNYNDASLVREKVAPDLFRSFGVPAPRTAFYEVYIDHGEGPIFFGVYTMLEIVFDTPMLQTQFANSTGNCYKPDGDGAAFGLSDFDIDDIIIKNYESSDKTKIQEFYDILHSDDRKDSPELWRTNLEKVFDVQGYLKYLAVNTTIQNWDTYGLKTHNYYLYLDPTDGLIKWIPWDNNEAFQTGKEGGALSFNFNEITNSNWPIIGYVAKDSEYKSDYEGYLDDFTTTIFNSSNMTTIYNTEESILSASAAKELDDYTYLDDGDISSEISDLISHANARNQIAQSYVNSQQ